VEELYAKAWFGCSSLPQGSNQEFKASCEGVLWLLGSKGNHNQQVHKDAKWKQILLQDLQQESLLLQEQG
jgi:hypothetical protein